MTLYMLMGALVNTLKLIWKKKIQKVNYYEWFSLRRGCRRKMRSSQTVLLYNHLIIHFLFYFNRVLEWLTWYSKHLKRLRGCLCNGSVGKSTCHIVRQSEFESRNPWWKERTNSWEVSSAPCKHTWSHVHISKMLHLITNKISLRKRYWNYLQKWWVFKDIDIFKRNIFCIMLLYIYIHIYHI